MSWSSGSGLASELIASLKGVVDDEDIREEFYDKMIGTFEDYDCDTLPECYGEDPAFDAALKSRHILRYGEDDWNDTHGEK